MRVMTALDDLGVRLAVDDYGTGYSSLEYLLTLPISEIKLDRAFSKHVVTELRATAIVRSTIDLTHALGLRMVAEGVEDEGTLFILRELGCDRVQGWHLGRPMPAVAFETLVHRRPDRWADPLPG
jgi:EAL domain-containing protein (putative c-di-GMP-specific phosphodiesterase class I)